jgi:hypothetical protein
MGEPLADPIWTNLIGTASGADFAAAIRRRSAFFRHS